jgi:hypothetical protein
MTWQRLRVFPVPFSPSRVLVKENITRRDTFTVNCCSSFTSFQRRSTDSRGPKQAGKDTEKIADSWMSKIGVFQVMQKLKGRFPYHQASFTKCLHLRKQEEGDSNCLHTKSNTATKGTALRIFIQLKRLGWY